VQPAGAKPHFSKCRGSTQQSKTRRRGASNVLEIVKLFMFLVQSFKLLQVTRKIIKAVFPEGPKHLDVRGDPLERLSLYTAWASLRNYTLLEEPGLLQQLQVPRDSRKAYREGLRQLSNRGLALNEACQDRPTSRVCKSAEYQTEIIHWSFLTSWLINRSV